MSTTPTIISKPAPGAYVFYVLAFGVLAGSSGPIFIRLAQAGDIPALAITGMRMVIATTLLTPLVLHSYRPYMRQLGLRDLLLAVAAGSFFSASLVIMMVSLQLTSVLVNQVLVATSPIWAAMLETLFLKTRMPRVVWGGIGLAFLGGCLIAFSGLSGDAGPGSDSALLGGLLAALSAVGAAAYLTIGRKVRGGMPLVPYLWLMYSSAAVITLLVILVSGMPLAGYSAEGYFWVLMLTLITQLMGHSSFNYALRFIPATFISISTQLGVVASTVWAYLIFHEMPGLLHIIGSGVIIAGVVIVTRARHETRQSRPEVTPPPA